MLTTDIYILVQRPEKKVFADNYEILFSCFYLKKHVVGTVNVLKFQTLYSIPFLSKFSFLV